MFGSTSQKPGGFSFGAPSAGLNNTTTSTPGTSFNFGGASSNNNNNSNTAAPAPALGKSSGFSFGNSSNTQSTGATQGSGFSFGKPATATQPATSGFSFGNNNTTNNGTSTSKPSLFGNSATNPSFNSSAGLGFAQNNFLQSQQQQQGTNTSPYNVNMENLANMAMPKSLTRASTQDELKLKRKRACSVSSQAEKQEPVSLVGRIVSSFKEPSKYTFNSVRGLFSSSKKSPQEYDHNAHKSNELEEQLKHYSSHLGLNIPRKPAAKSEYRRLVIKNSRDVFNDYKKIDANAVMLAKRDDGSLNKYENIKGPRSEPEKIIIDSLKPPSKRQKRTDDPNKTIDLTFSKPLTEQLSNVGTSTTTFKNEKAESDYWCTPSTEELSKLSSLELAHVENFTAGRKGFGNLMYKYPVDLSAFEGKWEELLGNTILFEKKLLQVYPDETEKPSQGNGLNVPAVITLERVFPRNYNPMNPDIEALEEHIEKLKSTHGMKFISFDPITGNYVFEVEHFSIWGIVDEEDDDPEIVAKWQKQQHQELQNEKRRNEMQINALEKIAGYGQPGDNWKRQKPNLGAIAPGAFVYGDQLGDNDDDEDDENLDDNLVLAEKRGEDDIVDASVPSALEGGDDDARKLELLNKNIQNIDELVEVRAYEPEVKDINLQFLNAKTELSISDNWDEQLSMSNGFFSVFNKNLDNKHDLNLDSKTVGDLIFAGTDSSKLKKAIIEPPLNYENAEHYQQCLRNEIRESKFIARSNRLPKVNTDDNISLNIPLKSFETTSAYNVWELLSILYDTTFLESFLSANVFAVCGNDTTSPKFQHIMNIKKRTLLCEFLLKLAATDDTSSMSAAHDSTEKIYHFLCVGKLTDAIQYSINTKNQHMAVLLTMLDSNDSVVHELARGQLEEWNQGTLNFIPSGVLKIYKLLSGDILSKRYIDHLEGLSWPVILYLLVKYGDINKPLATSLREFTDYFEGNGMIDETLNEIYYSILKLTVGADEEILKKFDVELQFMLVKYLDSHLKVDDATFDDVVRGFAEKLEKKNYVEEAIYVLEHMNSDDRAESLIGDLLNDNVVNLGLRNSQTFQSIQHDLHLPQSLLHEARAFEYRRTGDYCNSLYELLAAENLSEAHKLLLEHVAPDFIIANKAEDLRKLSSLIGEFGTLAECKVGAEVYGDYVKVITLEKDIDHSAEDYPQRREELVTAVEGVLNGITLLADTNSKVKIVKTIMTKRLISVAFREDLGVAADTLMSLELPESERNYLEAKLEDVKMITN